MSYSAEVLADAPLLYWRLGETSGTVAADASGNGNAGTYTGTYTQGVAGVLASDTDKAVSFGGGNVTLPYTLDPTAVTAEAWVKTTDAGTAAPSRVVIGRRAANASTPWTLELSANVPRFEVYSGTGAVTSAVGTVAINDNQPHHLVGTWSAADGLPRLYVDGVLVATGGTARPTLSTADTPITVGTNSTNARPYSGVIDEVAYYPTALSAARILAHYNANAAAPQPVVVVGQSAAVTATANTGTPITPVRIDGESAPVTVTALDGIPYIPPTTLVPGETATVTVAAGDGVPVVPTVEPVTLPGETATITITALDGTLLGVAVNGEPAGVVVTALDGTAVVEVPLIVVGTARRNLDVSARRRTGTGFVEIDVPVAPEPPTIVAAPIKVVVDTLPAPGIAAGQVGPMTPTVLRGTEWGRIRVTVSHQDVTYFRDKPAQVVDYQLLDPYGYGPATLKFPQVTFWELPDFGTGPLSWLTKNATVRIQHVSAGEARALLWFGHIDAFDFDDDGALVCDCSGELAGRMDKTHRTQRLVRTVNDAGSLARIAASIQNRAYRLKGSAEQWARTGIPMENTGGGMGTNLGFLDYVLATAVTEDLQSWTIMPTDNEPHVFDLVQRDTTTVHATVYLGARGVRAQLRDDQLEQPTRMFGEGVAPDGARWRGAEYPNLGPETVPPYPYTDGRTFGTVGLTDADTDTGDGVSVLEDELLGSGLLDLDQRDGTWSLRTSEAIEETQRRAGLPVTGQVDAATWRAVWGDGDDQQMLTQARIFPLVWRDETEKWLYSPNGSRIGLNPLHDRTVPRIERMVSFGEGVSKRRARRWLNREMRRANNTNWRGTISLSSDVLVGEHTFGGPGTPLSRLDLKAGQNILVKRFGSTSGTLMHIASAQVSGLDGDSPQVELAVDTQFRDAITLAEMLERDKAARLDPARRWLNQHRRSAMPSDALVGWDREAGAGVVRHTQLTGGTWNVVKVVGGQAGEVQRIDLTTTDAPAAFVCAVFARPIRPGELNGKVGDPFVDYGAGETIWTQPEIADLLAGIQTKEERQKLRDKIARWEEQQQEDLTEHEAEREERIADMFAILSDTRAGVYVAGTTEQPCGYWPQHKTNANGDPTGNPITGRWRDDAGFSYWTLGARSPWLYLAVYPDRDCTISGRMYDQLLEGS